MSAYRYVIFPRGRQPAADEVRRLERFAGALANQWAWGSCRDDGRLTIAFEARAFDHVAAADAGFAALIETWQSHGAELAEHLKFVKDATALKPVRTASKAISQPRREEHEAPATWSQDPLLAAKRLTAREAVGRSRLDVAHTLERYAALQRLAAAFPYLLILLAIAVTMAAGLYIRGKLTSAGYEPRQRTIERALADPVEASAEGDSAP